MLPTLCGRILVPDSVHDELRKNAAPKAVRQWIAKPPEWLEIRTPTMVPDAELLRASIGPGERDGRREAERRRVHAIGTLGVLRITAKRRLLNLKDALTSLRATNSYIDQELFDRLIMEAEQ